MKNVIQWKQFALIVAASVACFALQAAGDPDSARWERQARNVTVIRDDWGIAHVYGKTDADAVFGAIYAQAEDDFNRVETNYINSMGRLAEAEGESKIYQDLRMKLFIDPAELKTLYTGSPAWLKALMNAWADGLNFYLSKHPNVKPSVIRRPNGHGCLTTVMLQPRARNSSSPPRPPCREQQPRRPVSTRCLTFSARTTSVAPISDGSRPSSCGT